MTFEDPVIAYDPPDEFGSARRLVRLAGIFNLILAIIDFLYGLGCAAFAILLLTGIIPQAAFDDSTPGVAASSEPSTPVILGLALCMYAVLSVAAAIVKMIGATKLLKKSRHAWGWGLAAGIVGCIQLWCSIACVVPLAGAIYTLVALGQQNVRRYLRAGVIASTSGE